MPDKYVEIGTLEAVRFLTQNKHRLRRPDPVTEDVI